METDELLLDLPLEPMPVEPMPASALTGAASGRHSPAARRGALESSAPFLKWAGGKTQLLPALDRVFPKMMGDYFEPFVGGGAVFFYLRRQGRIAGRATLADVNPELMNAYAAVQNDVEQLLDLLESHRRLHCRDHYYSVRSEPFAPGVVGAARTIYLNKTGFNGLYRVNRRGGFNVPMGRYRNPSIYDETVMRAASAALQGVRLATQTYAHTLAEARRGDFIYLDPPYVPLSSTALFTSYHAGGFGIEDQAELSRCVRAAHERNAWFVLSNAYVPLVEDLYAGFRIEQVPATRRINCDGTKRGLVTEALVMNYGLAHRPGIDGNLEQKGALSHAANRGIRC